MEMVAYPSLAPRGRASKIFLDGVVLGSVGRRSTTAVAKQMPNTSRLLVWFACYLSGGGLYRCIAALDVGSVLRTAVALSYVLRSCVRDHRPVKRAELSLFVYISHRLPLRIRPGSVSPPRFVFCAGSFWFLRRTAFTYLHVSCFICDCT